MDKMRTWGAGCAMTHNCAPRPLFLGLRAFILQAQVPSNDHRANWSFTLPELSSLVYVSQGQL